MTPTKKRHKEKERKKKGPAHDRQSSNSDSFNVLRSVDDLERVALVFYLFLSSFRALQKGIGVVNIALNKGFTLDRQNTDR